ncbi:DUF624 domain-containing protein [Exiguobacterium sp. SH0S2]|uniref:DUF624 domain-containing protein n=1 Tax=Exiguobacterium sp. SH0S2 TaxID=2510950 RepID=UPI001039D26A|nr:DUF624 domain-containing protein [Exiguobacterium sp. SH0S2]TCI63223.1 DUF624 domain-containing protein [Exiguobacterium sp. SH0S2]
MNLKHEHNKLFQVLEFVTSLVQLNVVFLLSILPLITLFPALYALNAVTRQWAVNQDYSVFRAYFRFFNEGVRRHYKLGAVWTLFLLILLIDFLLIRQIDAWQTMLFTGLFVIGFVFIALSLFLFPILTHYEMKTMDALKLALFSIMRYGYIIVLALLLFTALGMLAYRSPLYLLFGFSFIVFLTTKLYLHQLDRTITSQHIDI